MNISQLTTFKKLYPTTIFVERFDSLIIGVININGSMIYDEIKAKQLEMDAYKKDFEGDYLAGFQQMNQFKM